MRTAVASSQTLGSGTNRTWWEANYTRDKITSHECWIATKHAKYSCSYLFRR